VSRIRLRRALGVSLLVVGCGLERKPTERVHVVRSVTATASENGASKRHPDAGFMIGNEVVCPDDFESSARAMVASVGGRVEDPKTWSPAVFPSRNGVHLQLAQNLKFNRLGIAVASLKNGWRCYGYWTEGAQSIYCERKGLEVSLVGSGELDEKKLDLISHAALQAARDCVVK
jgi:hypothetical protein